MTLPDDIRTLATGALAKIAAAAKGQVRASRRGVVAAVAIRRDTHIFRRSYGVVQFEVWIGRDHPQVATYILPADLERKAGKMLDNL